MSYLKSLRHTCSTYCEHTKTYIVHTCKACREKERIKKEREEYLDMTRTIISWDEYSVML